MRLLLCVLALCACDRAQMGTDDLAGPGADLTISSSPDLWSACPRPQAAADRTRWAVVSHPYNSGGQKANTYEVLELSAAGTLTRKNVTFMMGRAMYGAIWFTPDGEIGMVAQEDGSLGVFRLDASGAPTVIHAAFKDGFYAHDVLIDASGQHAWVLDENTDNNGGGVYRVAINCDGTLTGLGRVLPGGKGNVLALIPGDPPTAVYASGPMPGDVHLVDLSGTPKITASGDAFGDGMAIPSAATVTTDGKLALIADNGLFAGNRVTVVNLPSLQRETILTTPNPVGFMASPFGDAVLLLNSDGMDALRVITTNPVAIKGEITYVNGKPELPSVAVMIARGALRGRVLIAENVAVRQVQFAAGATVTDVAKLSFGSGLANIVGTVGVQP